jgi:hypothetical protein
MENTAKNFVLQLGALVSLYVSLAALVTVIFGIVNLMYPDAAEGYYAYESAQSSIRFALATVIVFFPVYVVLTRIVNQIRRKEHGVYLTLTRWLIYLSLFVGSAVLLGDLVSVLWSFLNGEITVRFLLKAGALLLVVAAALKYYILDIRGYWTTHERHAQLYAGVASLAVLTAIVLGFMNIDTPNTVREYRIDQQELTDLQDIEWHVESYAQTNGAMPDSIPALYAGETMPVAPEGREAYEYRATGANTYELCAWFAQPSTRSDATVVRPTYDGTYPTMNTNWDHDAGRVCFSRIVPPAPKPLE